MGSERDSGYYDQIYSDSKEYQDKDYRNSRYAPVWQKAIEWLKPSDKIVEIGCGTGQFAKMCFDNNLNYLAGFDFSAKAIHLAKFLNLMQSEKFKDACALNPETYKNLPEYDTVICFEVLEHIERDIDVLKNIKSGTKVIFSVPDFWDNSHVRVFEKYSSVIDRYLDIISFGGVYIHAFDSGSSIYLCFGTKK